MGWWGASGVESFWAMQVDWGLLAACGAPEIQPGACFGFFMLLLAQVRCIAPARTFGPASALNVGPRLRFAAFPSFAFGYRVHAYFCGCASEHAQFYRALEHGAWPIARTVAGFG